MWLFVLKKLLKDAIIVKPNHFSTSLGFRKVCLCNSASLITEMKNINFCFLIAAETDHFLVTSLVSLIWINPRGKNW